MRTFLPVVAALWLTTAAVFGQRLAVYDPIASTMLELQPPTALLPGPNPPAAVYPTAPILPPPPILFPMPGDSTFDNVVGLHWYTDGATLAAMPTPSLAPLGPVPPPIPIPAPILGMIGGPVTGIALDPIGLPATGPIMYLCSIPGVVVGVAPAPGLPILVPPFPLPFPGAPVAGLEWDGATGSLWAVDIGFFLHNFLPGGVPLGPPMLPLGPVPGPPGDLAIDKLGTLNPAGLRPLYIAGGGLIVDAMDPAGAPFPSGPPGEGVAFVNHPAEIPPLPGCEGCPGISTGPTAFVTSVMSTGNGAFSVGSGGHIPGAGFVVFAFDAVTAPAPFPTTPSCPLGLTLSATLVLALGGPADAAGNIFLPLSLAAVPVGIFLHNQNFVFCSSLPGGFAFSRFQTITVGGF